MPALKAIAAALCVALTFSAGLVFAAEETKATLKVESEKVGAAVGDRYAFATACDAKSRKLYAFGGEKNGTGGFEFCADMMVCDLSAKAPAWSKLTVAGAQPHKRAYAPFAPYLKESKAYMFGGFLEGATMTDDFWCFSTKDATWEKIHDTATKGAPPARDAMALTVDEETGTVWLFGGLKNFSPLEALGDLWKWEPKTKKWTEIKAKAGADWPSARYFHSLHAIGGNKALLYGGNTDGAPKVKEQCYFWELDLKAGTWKKLTQPKDLRCYQDSLWHPDLKRLIVLNGGYAEANDDVFAYDPATDSWEKCGGSGHAHTFGTTVLDSKTGDLYTLGGLKEMSFFGKHAVDEMYRVKISKAK